MARDDVNIKVSANVAEAIRLWKAMQEGPEQMAREMDGLAAAGKKGAKGMASEMDRFLGRLTAVTMALAAAKKLFSEWQALRRGEVERQGRAADSVDSASRQLYVQAGSKGDWNAMRKQVLDIAVARSANPTQAFNAATQLVSSGFTADQVLQGGVLDDFLKNLAATNQTGQGIDSQSLAKSISLFLNATGQMNRQGMQSTGVATQNLFQGTNLQLSDLQRHAPEAGVIAQMTGMKTEQLGVLAQFLNNADIAKASTAFRSGVVSLATASAMPKKVRALQEIGLTPGDVDFQGENFFQVQETLTKALQQVAPEVRNRVMARLFGAEGILFGTTLLTPEGVAQSREYQKIAANRGSFDAAVQINEGSLAARRERETARESRAFFREDFVDPELVRKAIINWIEERNQNGFAKGVNKTIAGAAFDASMYMGGDPESAARAAINTQVFTADAAQRAQEKILDRARAEHININLTLTDQDKIAIPHKSEVTKRSKE